MTGSTTYGYVSLMRTVRDPEVDEGTLQLFPGKKDKVEMPTVVHDDEVVGTKYDREAVVELPERMTAQDAFDWCREHRPAGLEEFYEDTEAPEA